MSSFLIRALAAAFCGFAMVEFLFYGGFGIGLPLTVAIFYMCLFLYERGIPKAKSDRKLLIPVILSVLNFALFDNAELKFYNFLFLVTLLVLHTSSLYGANKAKPYSFAWFINVIPLCTKHTKKDFDKNLTNSQPDKTRQTTSFIENKQFVKIFTGFLIGIPLLFVVGSLLSSADAAFQGIMQCVTQPLSLFIQNIDINSIAKHFIPISIVSCLFFRYFDMLAFHGAFPKPAEARQDVSTLKYDFLIVMTVVSLLGTMYLLFLFSQLTYFFSAFSGILPADFTHSQYARRGFFEMLPITVINVAVIGILSGEIKGRDVPARARILKGFSLYFAGFTAFFILTALAKMILYMNAYGLTILRVYATWFLILCLISLGLVITRLFVNTFRLVQNLYMTFVVMFLGLIYCNVDYLIAKYNVAFYHRNHIDVMGSFRELSLSAAGPLMEMQDADGAASRLEIFQNRVNDTRPWEQFNLAYANAGRLLSTWNRKAQPEVQPINSNVMTEAVKQPQPEKTTPEAQPITNARPGNLDDRGKSPVIQKLTAGDTAVELTVYTDRIMLTSLRDLKTDKEWISEPQQLALPQTFRLNDQTLQHKWALLDTADSPSSAGFVLSFTDTAGSNLKYTLTVSTRGIFEFSGLLENTSDSQDVRVIPGDIFSLTITPDTTAPTVWRFAKESGEAEGFGRFPGTGIYKTVLTKGTTVTASTTTFQNHNSNGEIPMFYIDNDSKGVYIALEWPSGTLNAEGICSGTKLQTAMRVNLHNDFSTVLPAGAKMTIPTVYVGTYQGDVEEGSNLFKQWFFATKTPLAVSRNSQEPLTQIDMQIPLTRLATMGVQSVKWDYGWWSNQRDPESFEWTRTLEGDWELRNTDCINALKPYGIGSIDEFRNEIKARRLNWTLYALLHDSRSTSPMALTSVGPNGHPEWFSDRKITSGHSADLGNTDCVAFLKNRMEQLFPHYSAMTWRSDFEPICSTSDKKNRHDANGTDVQYWCTVGFTELLEHLQGKSKSFRYESCSSGGSMKDFLTMKYAAVINCDDSANYNSLRTTFYDTSYCLHPTQIQLPCNPDTFCKESPSYAGPGDKDYGMRSIILGAPMFGSHAGPQDGKLRYDLELYYTKYLNMYCQKIRPLQRLGKLYHILPRPDNIHWDGIQYVVNEPASAPNNLQGCVFVFKPTGKEGPTKKIVLRGLSEYTTYKMEFEDRPQLNVTRCGADLMNPQIGIDVTIPEECGSDILWIKL